MRETQFRICYNSRRFCYEKFRGGRPMRARKDAVERLLAAYRRYYTITRFDGVREAPGEGLREAKELTAPFLPEGASLSAVCEYYERAERYFILHSNELWSTHQEEFVFVFSVPHLSKKVFDACRDYAYQAGMDMAHIGSGHRSFCATRSMRKPGSPWKSASITRPSASPSTDGWSTMRDVWHFVTIGSISIRQDAAWKRA